MSPMAATPRTSPTTSSPSTRPPRRNSGPPSTTDALPSEAMTITYEWRGEFTSAEANELHAEAFATRVFSVEEWDWRALVEAHSVGWVVARDDDGALAGFVNVVW